MARSEKTNWIAVVLVSAAILFLSRKAVERLGNILPRMIVRMDPKGDGHFGSGRTGHTHQGTDFLAIEGEDVRSPMDGKIVHYSSAYQDDQTYRNIVIHGGGIEVKIMYARLAPGVQVGDRVTRGQRIATAQAVSQRYGGRPMLDHLHVEARKVVGGELLNPEHLFHLS